tara:strand:+ start:141 stop:1292 length:1152 start_codon:yes stop_codon:yes gene_type:complete
MRFSCLQENLNKALSMVGRAVATRTTLPITQNVLIGTEGGRIKLTATNLEIAITTWIGGKVEDEGSITVPARLFSDFVASLPEGQVEVALTPKPLGIQITSSQSEGRVLGTSGEEFPLVPTVDEGVGLSIGSRLLREAIEKIAFAAATEDSRPVLTGVKMEIDGEKATFAAADGFRLAVKGTKLSRAVASPISCIIPARTLRELERLLSDQVDPVEFTVTSQKNQVMFKLKDVELVSQLIQGAFPNYSQLIPQDYSTRTTVGLGEFTRAIRTASVFARDGSGIVRIHVTPGSEGEAGKMVISARADEVGDNTGTIEASVQGEEAKIAFSGKYLTDVLSVLGTDVVALETTTSSSPGVVRSAGPDGAPTDDDYVHVVMPMFVQW